MRKKLLITLSLIPLLLTACAGQAVTPALTFIDPGIDPEAWATIPAGEFLSGQHEHEVLVDYDYQMMVTDVTNAQFARYINKALKAGQIKVEGEQVLGYYPGDEFHAHEHEVEIKAGDYIHISLDDPGSPLSFDGVLFHAQPEYANHPVTLVSWFGAKAYCEFFDWRLPSETEWEKAARGTDARPFPWGDELQRNNANYYSSFDLFEKIFGKFGSTTPVGFYNGKTYDGYQTIDSSSPYGLYDMAGNVWQWTADVYEKQHYRYMRGGSKDNYGYNLRVWTRNSAGPEYISPAVGFRCARGGIE